METITLEQIDEQIAGIQQEKQRIADEAKLLILQLDAAEQALQIVAMPARRARLERESAQLSKEAAAFAQTAHDIVNSQPAEEVTAEA